MHFVEKNYPQMSGKLHVCLERIRDAQIKGVEGEEKVFVEIERRIGVCHWLKEEKPSEERIREVLWPEEGDDPGHSRIVETRNIVFMRDQAPAVAAAAVPEGVVTKFPMRMLNILGSLTP